jgi:hypothetical protein
MFNQPRTSKLYMTTPVYIFFLCFDFSFEVNRYLVLFVSITVPYCCGCRSLIDSFDSAMAAIP